jgi:hypothetical protein
LRRIIDAIGEVATEASLAELRASLDLLHGRLACMDTTQQQQVELLELISTTVQDNANLHDGVVRQLATMEHCLDATMKALANLQVCSSSPEEDDADLEVCVVTGKGTLRPAQVTWTGNTVGASLASPTGGGSPKGDHDGVVAWRQRNFGGRCHRCFRWRWWR